MRETVVRAVFRVVHRRRIRANGHVHGFVVRLRPVDYRVRLSPKTTPIQRGLVRRVGVRLANITVFPHITLRCRSSVFVTKHVGKLQLYCV